MVNTSWFRVNLNHLPLKAHYLLFYGGAAGFYTFLPIIAGQQGLSPSAFGLIYTIMPFFDMVCSPLFGYIADRFKCWKPMTYVSLAGVCILSFIIYFIPYFTPSLTVTDFEANLLCEAQGSRIQVSHTFNTSCLDNVFEKGVLDCDAHCTNCSVAFNDYSNSTLSQSVSRGYCQTSSSNRFKLKITNYSMISENHLAVEGFRKFGNLDLLICPENPVTSFCQFTCNVSLGGCLGVEPGETPYMYHSFRFWMFFLGVFFNWIPLVCVWVMSSAICFEILEDKPELFGNQRLWGSVGSGLVAILCGILVQGTSELKNEVDYLPIFIVQAVIYALDILTITRLKVVCPPPPDNLFKNIGGIFRIPHFIGFFVATFFLGGFLGMQWTCQFWYLKSLGASSILLGMVQAADTFLGEIPFFYLSGYILSKLGYYLSLAVSFLTFGLRFLLYSFLQNPWFILLIEITQGPSYSLLTAAMPSYAKEMAPKGLEATMQGVTGISFNVGLATGILFGSMSYETYGARPTWRGFAALGLVGALALFSLHFAVPSPKKAQPGTSPHLAWRCLAEGWVCADREKTQEISLEKK